MLPIGPQGLYNPSYERDSCGIGCIADVKGRANRKIVTDGNKILIRLTHRGAKQGEDGDGAGIMVGMPHRYFKKLSYTGQLPFLSLPPAGRYGVGMMFLPNGEGSERRRVELMDKIEQIIHHFGLSVLGWRSPLPTKSSILGPVGRATEPFPVQLFVCRPEDNEDEKNLDLQSARRTFSMYDDCETPYLEPLCDMYDPESSFCAFASSFEEDSPKKILPTEFLSCLEKRLYLIRKRLARWTDMYVCSFSSATIVYKGQLQSEQLFSYYDDLMDEDFTSYFAIVHSRFSTNTFPTWDRAHPFRRIAHNGEINTIESNRRWLVAKEGIATAPKSFGLNLRVSDLMPFEEPCHVVSFSAPAPIDGHHRLKLTKKQLSPPIPCGGVPHVRDSLAVPTDIVSARKGSVMSKEPDSSVDSLSTADFKDQYDGDEMLDSSHVACDAQSTCSVTQNFSTLHSSDSALLDNIVELLMMSGRDIVEAVMLLVPEALYKTEPQWKHDYFNFNSCVMEPWDGPALIAFTDGQQFGALLDRNGLRPGRYILSKDNTLVLASEVGVVDTPPSMIVKKGRILPGKILLVDFRKQQIIDDEVIKLHYAHQYPYGKWLKQNAIHLNDFCIAMTENDLRRELHLPQPLSSENLSTAVAEFVASMDDSGSIKMFSQDLEKGNPSSADATTSKNSLSNFADTLHSVEESHIEAMEELKAQLTMFGYTTERLDVLLSPMAKYAAEALGSMGNDTPLACLSELPRTPSDYFHQMFAQGTNPPIDPIRETEVMSLSCTIGPQGDLFTVTPQHVKRIFLKQPVLKPSEYKVLTTLPGFPTATIDLTTPRSMSVFDLKAQLCCIQQEAVNAVRSGCHILILSDARAGMHNLPIWTTLATGAVHLHLIAQQLRLRCAIVVETGEASEVHQIALLLSSGADAIYPYLAFRALCLVKFHENEEILSLSRLIENYITAIHLGLLRVMSKIGICTISSYKGGFFFQSLGIATNVLQMCFDAGTAAIGGVSFQILAEDTLRFHLKAFPPYPFRPLLDGLVSTSLPDTGEYHFVSVQDAELHSSHPDTISLLQQAVRVNDKASYRKYAEIQNALIDETEIRGQLEFVYGVHRQLSLSEVEPVSEVVKRFVTSAMSYGSISEEAYITVAQAMNKLGCRSNTGEGGELEGGEKRFSFTYRTKQIGSARFGVTAEYLCDAQELQIKCGQGSSPGDGEELPGYKVVHKIANARRSTPGVGLISPPPHHDMYSIEDVAQLIMDLKHINPKARVSIKLASKLGVGVIAAGCLKAKADHLVISGTSGGTGASKLSSIKHSGLPWEIGLAETHQTLCLNGLRDRVSLQVDGGLRTGRDVVIAALLGAEEFGFGTYPLISLGCVMQRKCHLNACLSGIATQDPELRKRFQGEPEYLINYFFMVAEEARLYMARLGIRQFNQMIGRSDLLRAKTRLKEHWKRHGLDFQQTLMPGWKLINPLDRWQSTNEQPLLRPMYCIVAQDHELDKVLDREIIRRARRSLQHKVPTTVLLPIRNVDRSVGGLLANEVVTRYGNTGLPAETIRVNFRGAAGQSFACWLPHGVTFYLSGDCNDFAGKGLSGGTLIVKPPSDSLFFHESNQNIICGNAALYGATSGHAFFNGIAGERFAVRNSGAVAVVEGCGDFGCEYMTRGIVLILGKTGRSFAAGMTGGIAYVLDLCPSLVNTQMVELQPLISHRNVTERSSINETIHSCPPHDILKNMSLTAQIAELLDLQQSLDTCQTTNTDHDTTKNQFTPKVYPNSTEKNVETLHCTTVCHETPMNTSIHSDDEQTITYLLNEHLKKTNSCIAQRLLNEMPESLSRFTKVFPKEIRRVLKQAIADYIRTGDADAAALLDDWETMTTQALKLDAFYLQTLPFTMRQFTEKYQRRERQKKRVECLNLHENALRGLGGFASPSPLEQYASELIYSGRFPDLLRESHIEQLTHILKTARIMYIQWRKGYHRGIRKGDLKIIRSLLPTVLTPSRRMVLKKFLFEERQHLYEHLQALEDNSLARMLLAANKGRTDSTTQAEKAGSFQVEHLNLEIEKTTAETLSIHDENNEWNSLFYKSSNPKEGLSLTNVSSELNKYFPEQNGIKQSTSTINSTSLHYVSNRKVSNKLLVTQHPDHIRGFLLYEKLQPPMKAPSIRVLDWEEISIWPLNAISRVFEQLMKTQASRCTECGTPTCNYPTVDHRGGCPLGNRIPTWTTLIFEGQWKIALERLLDTNNFPEFTGRVCPAPCESSCLVGSTNSLDTQDKCDPVAIKSIECAIIERGFQKGWISALPPFIRTKFAIAIIGSGPSGLAAAQQLNRAGHRVTIYEKESRGGGLLMYGIPNMRLDKKLVVERRIQLLKDEGITFKFNTAVGKDAFLEDLLHHFNAVLLAVGQSIPKNLPIEGNHSKGIVQAKDFLGSIQEFLFSNEKESLNQNITKQVVITKATGVKDTDYSDHVNLINTAFLNEYVCGKRVVIIGWGYLATDCLATVLRLGCNSVIQLCCQLSQDPNELASFEYAHEEALIIQGQDPRVFNVFPISFTSEMQNSVEILRGVRAIRVTKASKSSSVHVIQQHQDFSITDGHWPANIIPIRGTERLYLADLAILALGFSGVDFNSWKSSPHCQTPTKIQINSLGNVIAPPNEYRTNLKGLFACGDCRTGASLIATCIAEGRDVARSIDDFLMQEKQWTFGYQPPGLHIEWSLQRPDSDHLHTSELSTENKSSIEVSRTKKLEATALNVTNIKLSCDPTPVDHEKTLSSLRHSNRQTLPSPPPPLKNLLAFGPISRLSSALPTWSNPHRRNASFLD